MPWKEHCMRYAPILLKCVQNPRYVIIGNIPTSLKGVGCQVWEEMTIYNLWKKKQKQLTSATESKLSAGHSSIISRPWGITDSAPSIVVANFNLSFKAGGSISQSDVSSSAHYHITKWCIYHSIMLEYLQISFLQSSSFMIMTWTIFVTLILLTCAPNTSILRMVTVMDPHSSVSTVNKSWFTSNAKNVI